MKGRIIPFPGSGCRHYRQGRCLYEERLNPGLDSALRCRTLTGLEAAYEDFLRQAESFSLDPEQAGNIWAGRFPGLLAAQSHCQDYLAGDNENFLGCVFAEGDVCLKALPPCPGRCPRFVKRDDAAEEKTPQGE